MKKLKSLPIFLLLGALTFSLFFPSCGTNNYESGSTSDTSGNESVTAYKAERIETLLSYANGKNDENYYSESAYSFIFTLLEESVKNINDAETLTDIDEIFQSAKAEIDGIPTIEVLGEFYTLQEAYDNEFLTLADLQAISQTERIEFDELPVKIANSFKNLYYRELREATDENGNPLYPNASVNDIKHFYFYGEYNNVYCFMLWNPYEAHADAERIVIIEGIEFTYPDYGAQFLVWKN